MRTFNHLMMSIATLAAAIGGAPIEQPPETGLSGMGLDYYPKRKRGKGQNNRRGKGKTSPPKSRPNMLHVSKRTRRKHRRA